MSEALVRKDDRVYTYDDLRDWPEEQCWELINGIAFLQATPERRHQEALIELATQFHSKLRNSQCKVYSEWALWPYDAPGDSDAKFFFVPDLMVICNPDKIHRDGVKGAPDLVIEILSTSTAGMDKVKKLHVYQEIGVKEYWIVEPDQQVVMVFKLGSDGGYNRIETYQEGRIPVNLICLQMEIDLAQVFPRG